MTSPTPATPPLLSSPSISPEPAAAPLPVAPKRPLLWLWITLSVLAVLGAGGVLAYNYYFHAKIRPTELREDELAVLNQKRERIEMAAAEAAPAASPDEVLRESGRVKVLPPAETDPAPVAEFRDPRMLVLTQRELNGILNHNTELGQYLKIDMRPGAFDVTTVIPVPEEAPLFGGKTLRAGMIIGMRKADGGQMVLAVRSFTFLGIPLPSAWMEALGIAKGDDLLKDLREQYEWFGKFEEGIETIDLSSGEMRIKLAE